MASASDNEGPYEFVALQPVAIVDHLCAVDPETSKQLINDG